jgi:hypothetical protein
LKEARSTALKPRNSSRSFAVRYWSCSSALMRVFFADGGSGASPSSFTRRRRALDAPDEPASFFGLRMWVLRAAVEGGEPMTMPLACNFLGVDEEERDDDDDDGVSILHGVQRRGTCGMVSRGLLPAAMWSRTKARV